MATAGIAFDPALVHHGDTDENDGEATARQLMLLQDRPSALLLMGETAPVGAYRALRGMGLEPGIDIAVIGLRDNPTVRVLSPALTCFTLALDELGLALAHGIFDTIASRANDDASCVQRRWPMQMRIGDSHLCEGAPINQADGTLESFLPG